MKTFSIDIPIEDKHTYLIDGVVQFDSANLVQVQLLSNGSPYDFSAYSQVQLFITKPDGTVVSSLYIKDAETQQNPYNISVAAASGRIDFELKGQATVLMGVCNTRLLVYDSNGVMSTSRFNYHVSESTENIPTERASTDDISGLTDLIATVTLHDTSYSSAESIRQSNETTRIGNETTRISQMSTFLSNAQGYVDSCATYAEICEDAAEPKIETIETLLNNLQRPTAQTVQGWIDAKFAQGVEGNTVVIKIKRGLAASMSISEGEMYWATDTGALYLGLSGGSTVCLTQHYSRGSSAPTRTDILWIDSAHNNTLKFYNGASWVAAGATAVFS